MALVLGKLGPCKIELCQYDDNGAHVTLGKAANVALQLFYF